MLGPDLATAHFAVARHASVKFVDIDDWVKLAPKQEHANLPGNFVPGLFLEAVDASGTAMLYESFDNFGQCLNESSYRVTVHSKTNLYGIILGFGNCSEHCNFPCHCGR